MGLKTTNYTARQFGVTMPNAYARLVNVNVDKDGHANCAFHVTKSRDDSDSAVEVRYYSCPVNKDDKIFEQVYNAAKKELFIDWEDDIVEG